jgi:hypothetical protein
MKKILFLLLFPLLSNAQVDTSGIKWIDTTHDFGKIPFGIPVSYTYKFINQSSKSTEIISIEASCGCTQPTWTETMIAPGDTAFVKATFKANSEGPFKKSVTVYTDRNPFPTNLILFGEVLKKE